MGGSALVFLWGKMLINNYEGVKFSTLENIYGLQLFIFYCTTEAVEFCIIHGLCWDEKPTLVCFRGLKILRNLLERNGNGFF